MHATAGSQCITAVTTDADYEAFLSLPSEVYRENPNWIPPNPHFEAAEVKGRTPFARYCDLQPFIATSGGRVLARVLAIVDHGYNSHWFESAGHMAMFEALPDGEDAAIAMLQAAREWLKVRGCQFARQGFLLGWSMPFTIDAYHLPPTTFHAFNPPYYHSFIKNSGFITEKGIVQYQVSFTDTLAERYRDIVAQAQQAGIRLRTWDLQDMAQENERMTSLYNETFERHWAAPQINAEQWSGLTVQLKDFLLPEALHWAYQDEQLVGGVYALPDLNQAATGSGMDHGVLLTIGVRERFRGRGINTALGASCFLGFIQHGYKTASYTVVLDDNWPSRRTAEKLGCRVTRNFVVYRSELQRAGHR